MRDGWEGQGLFMAVLSSTSGIQCPEYLNPAHVLWTGDETELPRRLGTPEKQCVRSKEGPVV